MCRTEPIQQTACTIYFYPMPSVYQVLSKWPIVLAGSVYGFLQFVKASRNLPKSQNWSLIRYLKIRWDFGRSCFCHLSICVSQLEGLTQSFQASTTTKEVGSRVGVEESRASGRIGRRFLRLVLIHHYPRSCLFHLVILILTYLGL